MLSLVFGFINENQAYINEITDISTKSINISTKIHFYRPNR